MRKTGEFRKVTVSGQAYDAFFPFALPPDPPIRMEKLYAIMSEAEREMGRLDGYASHLPGRDWYLYSLVRKEALVSSQIEGTQSSYSDLLLFESGSHNDRTTDAIEVSNYISAVKHGLETIKENKLPLCVRLIRDLHRILLRGTRGDNKMPGEFRRSQNQIGGNSPQSAIFVPPTWDKVEGLMADLEKFIHEETADIPPLIKAGLIHVQFETIHPFLDGNGRIGRLLILLFLYSSGTIENQILYPSLYLKENRLMYYQLLQQIRTNGVWEEWLAFFLRGIQQSSIRARNLGQRAMLMFERDEERIRNLGSSANSALRTHEHLIRHPVSTIPSAVEKLNLTYPTVSKAFSRLQDLGIVQSSGVRWGKTFWYGEFIELLNEDTEPLGR